MVRNLLLNGNKVVTFTINPRPETITVDISDTKFTELTNNGYNNYTYENGNFIFHTDNLDKEKLQIELMDIQSWFASTDYIPNKIITGEWLETDQRWIDYLSQRTIKRARQDEINTILNI
jgi:hypothetical protein